jgi:hypothetical protein
MTDTITAPGGAIFSAAPGQTITVTKPSGAAGYYGALGDEPGDAPASPASRAALTPGSTLMLGPWTHPRRYRVDATVGVVSVAVSTPAVQYSTLLGKMESFTGNRTLDFNDNGRLLRCEDASNVTVTVPNNLAEGFNVGLLMFGTGSVTISAGSGATNRSSTSALSTQYQVGSLIVARNSTGSGAEFVLGGSFA